MKLPLYELEPCALPQVLSVVGERWTLLILREACSGSYHFEEFQLALGTPRNILARRLAHLVKHGILSRQVMRTDRRKVKYLLTEKGEALLPTLVALRQWGEKWEACQPSAPVLIDELTKQPIRQITVLAHDGRELALKDLCWTSKKNSDGQIRCEDV